MVVTPWGNEGAYGDGDMGWKLNEEKKVNRLQIDYMNEEEKIDDYSEGFWSINWKSGGYDKRCGIAGE